VKKWLGAHRGVVLGGALLLLAAWEVAVLLHAKAATPSDGDWRQAAAAVSADHKPGDLIVFAPAWVDPLARMYVGDLMTVEQVARMDAERYGRIWELSIRGEDAPETHGLGRPVFDRSFGRVRVRRWERQAPQVIWDLMPRAKLLEVDFTPRMCVPITIPPTEPGEIDLGTVQLGSRLSVYAGLSDFRSRKENYSYAKLKVFVDDQDATQGSIGNDSGWLHLPVAKIDPGEHRLVFEATVDKDHGAKDYSHLSLCVMAESYQ
jgi:hypothetical protein